MARIGQKLEKEIKKATRRYNTIVNRYNRKNPSSPPIARITNKQIMTSGMKADEIRLQIKLMSLLQGEQDFVRPTQRSVTDYELKQLDYLRKRQKADLTRKLNKMLKAHAAEIAKGKIIDTPKEIFELKAEIENLKKAPATPASAIRQLERAKRRQANKIKYGTYEAPDWAEVTRDHFVAALIKASLDNTAEGETAINIVTAMTNEQFAEFLRTNPHINIELAYDTRKSVKDRAELIHTALQAFASANGIRIEVVDTSEYEDTDEMDDFWYD